MYVYIYIYMVGGLEHFVLFHISGMVIPTDFHIYQRDWNQQLDNYSINIYIYLYTGCELYNHRLYVYEILWYIDIYLHIYIYIHMIPNFPADGFLWVRGTSESRPGFSNYVWKATWEDRPLVVRLAGRWGPWGFWPGTGRIQRVWSGNLWKPMESLWEINGHPWKPVEMHGKSMETCENLCKPVEIYGNPLKSMDIWCLTIEHWGFWTGLTMQNGGWTPRNEGLNSHERICLNLEKPLGW